MEDLVDLAIHAAGGMERFKRFRSVSAQLHHTGAIWALKQRDGVLTDSRVTVQLNEQRVSHAPFAPTTDHSAYTPSRVEIRRDDGTVVDTLDAPRTSFDGYEMETPWSNAQLAYFAGYTMWTYLTSPFLLRHSGVRSREIEPWIVDGLPWRRLHVEFAPEIATHSAVQTFYFDADGLLRGTTTRSTSRGATRLRGTSATTSTCKASGCRRVSGFIRVPTQTWRCRPLIVGVDLSNFRFE